MNLELDGIEHFVERASPSEILCRWEDLGNESDRAHRYHLVNAVASLSRCFTPLMLRRLFADASFAHARLLANPYFPARLFDEVLLLNARLLDAGTSHVDLRRVLGIAMRRGDLWPSAAVLGDLKTAVLAAPGTLVDQLTELYLGRIAAFEEAQAAGAQSAREAREILLEHYRRDEVECEEGRDQDTCGRVMVGHPLCQPEDALRLLTECENDGLVDMIAEQVNEGVHPEYARHVPLRRHLRKWLHTEEVALSLMLTPSREDFVEAVRSLESASPEALADAMEDDRVTPESLAWLGRHRVGAILASPRSGVRLKAIRALSMVCDGPPRDPDTSLQPGRIRGRRRDWG